MSPFNYLPDFISFSQGKRRGKGRCNWELLFALALMISLGLVPQPVSANNAGFLNLPVAQCQDVTVDAGEDCLANASIDNGSYDPDGGPVTIIETPSGPYPLGTTMVTLIITDDQGLADTCYGTVTVEDNTPPVADCPDDFSVNAAPGECGATVTFTAIPRDNCPGATVSCNPPSGSYFPVGVTYVECIATDASGNKCADTCDFLITVIDNQAPVVICPDDITVDNDPGECGAAVTFAATATDNCPGVNITYDPAPGTFFPVGTTTVTVIATDAGGLADTCYFDVTVNDTEDPVAQCPENMSVYVDAGQCSAVVTFAATVSDNCDGATVSCVPPSGSSFPLGTTTVTCTANDVHGNGSTCSFTIAVSNRNPEVVCPYPQGALMDVCDLSPVTMTGFSCSDPDNNLISCAVDKGTLVGDEVTFTPVEGVNTITLTATDACGATASCQTQIMVTLNHPPVVTCPGNETRTVCTLSPLTISGFSCSDADDNLNTCLVNKGILSGDAVTFTPVAGVNTITLTATDDCGDTVSCQTQVTVILDQPPVASCPNDTTVYLYDQISMLCIDGFECSDPEGQLEDCYIEGVSGYLDGDEVCFTPEEGANTIRLIATDGCGHADTCETVVTVVLVSTADCPTIKIEKTHGTLQGHFEEVRIWTQGSLTPLGGFDFLIAYDATALTLVEAVAGELLVDCDWEYFTYRFGADGNCSNACPSGLVRIVSLADIFDGANHPDCYGPTDTLAHDLAVLTFLVTNDRNFEGQYVPIYFFWGDCSDNSLSDVTGEYLFLDEVIYTYLGEVIWDESDNVTYPESLRPPFTGAAESCMEGYKKYPVRCVTFWNGGVDIIPSDEIDDRGDLNQNGVVYEIADAVMYTNFFVRGLGAFGDHVEASIAASEVNGDGVTLSVADLVYMVRVIAGDAVPYLKPVPGAELRLTVAGGEVRYHSATSVGAVLLVFAGEGLHPELGEGATGMSLEYGCAEGQTRVLVYSLSDGMVSAGEGVLVRLDAAAELLRAEASDYQGSVLPASVRVVPGDYELSQNYPNPFNPTTSISLSLPESGSWMVAIYNVAGQMIREYEGHSEAGTVTVIWDGTDASGCPVASGIYLYKAKSGPFTETRKMILMK